VLRGESGRNFALNAADLGSLDVGSPLYYRRTRVGRVVGYTLDPKTDRLEVQVFIESPNENLVTANTRFWNASGVDVSISGSGVNVSAESLVSLVSGGIAFGTPPGQAKGPPAADSQRFELYRDRLTALAPPDGPGQRVRMLFASTMRGLAPGAPVELMGQEVGSVQSVALRYDDAHGRFPVEVVAEIFPGRLGEARTAFLKATAKAAPKAAPNGAAKGVDENLHFLQQLVARGLRAQLRSGSLITGQPYVALDLVKNAPKAALALAGPLPTLPTASTPGQDLQGQAGELLERLGQMRF
jgi:paraquat-inducible protein B